jgi:hypothetical protein
MPGLFSALALAATMRAFARLPVMRRREFITVIGGAAVAWPFAAHAEQAGKLPIIGIIGASTAEHFRPFRGQAMSAMAPLATVLPKKGGLSLRGNMPCSVGLTHGNRRTAPIASARPAGSHPDCRAVLIQIVAL